VKDFEKDDNIFVCREEEDIVPKEPIDMFPDTTNLKVCIFPFIATKQTKRKSFH
jgi:hypothetical protein